MGAPISQLVRVLGGEQEICGPNLSLGKKFSLNIYHLMHYLQRFTGYFSTQSPLRHLLYLCTKVGRPVSQESTANFWSHEVAAICNSLLLQKCFPAARRRFCAAVSETSGEIDQKVTSEVLVLKNCLSHSFHQFWNNQERSATTVFFEHISSAFSELPTPLSDHTGISQLAGDNISAAIFSQSCAITTTAIRLKLYYIIPTYSSTARHASILTSVLDNVAQLVSHCFDC